MIYKMLTYKIFLGCYRKVKYSPEEHHVQHTNSRKAPGTPNHLEMRVDSLFLTQEECNFPQAPEQEASLSYRYLRGTLSFLPQVEWTPRCRDSKYGRISLQWLECRLVFHLPRWRDVWIPYGDFRENPSSLPHFHRRPHISLKIREALVVQCVKRTTSLTPLKNW